MGDQSSSTPTLGSLASKNMGQPSIKSSLGSLASQHLNEASPKPSLGNLAFQHLGQSIGNTQVMSPPHLAQPLSRLSLQSQAPGQSYSQQNLSPARSGFTIGKL